MPTAAGGPVGRDRELELLRHAFESTLAGAGRLVLVGGEAGIGKTTLVSAFARQAAARGALVLAGRCYDLTTTPPYGPWNEIVQQWSAGVLPPLEPRPVGAMEGVGGQRELLELMLSLRDASAARPHVLLLEDVHWSDPASLELLQVVARALGHGRLLLIVTYRDDEITRQHPLFALLPVLARTPGAERLTLAPLDSESTRRLVAARYVLPAVDVERLASFVQTRTEGNPLFISEVLQASEEDGALTREGEHWRLGDLALASMPRLVREVIESRLSRLGSATREALEVASVIGLDVPADVWIAASDLDEGRLAEATERAVAAKLVAELPRGAGFRFTHELVRETLYQGLGLLRRRGWHRRVGEALAAMPRPDPDAVAYHFTQCGDERAVDWLLRAAERAERAWAWVAAAERLETVLELLGDDALPAGERGWLLYRLAMLLRLTNPMRALDLLEQTVVLATRANDAMLIAHSRYNHARLKLFRLRWEGALEEMAEGVALLEALPPLNRAGHTQLDIVNAHTALGTYVNWLAQAGRFAEVRRGAERYDATRPSAAPVAAADGDVVSALAIADAFQGRPESASRGFRRAVEIYREAKELATCGCNFGWMLELCVIQFMADDVLLRGQLAEDFTHVWSELASLIGLPDMASVAHLPGMWLDGRWSEAGELARRINANPLAVSAQAITVPIFVKIGIARGNYAQVWQQLRRELPAGPDTPIHSPLVLERVRRAAEAALNTGERDLARAWLDAHDRQLDAFDVVLGHAEDAWLWSRYHQDAGDLTAAREQAERAVALARNPRQPLALGGALRQLGDLHRLTREHTAAGACLDESLRLAEDCAVPYERALTLLSLAELRRASRAAEAAREAASEARAIFAKLDVAPALQRAERLLQQLGRPTSALFPAGLTAREVEVLRLVTQGLTDAEIAERLFLARRTINTHLTSIYAKLGVSSRAAATRFAFEHGLV